MAAPAKTAAPKKKTASAGGAKKVSAYNLYMKSALADVKKKNPTLSHKDAFKEAAKQWKNHPDNPKRGQ